MKKNLGILIGITATTIICVAIYRKRRQNAGQILSDVSNQGYETAHDILYPNNKNKSRNLRFGPVFPE